MNARVLLYNGVIECSSRYGRNSYGYSVKNSLVISVFESNLAHTCKLTI